MQFQLCPRCKFRAPANKAVCSTCGYSFAAARRKAAAAEKQPEALPPPISNLRRVQADNSTLSTPTSIWRNFLGLNPDQPGET
ncbi:MAG: hypothetical protein K2W82_15645 [Candidatus Obscuribacterales bacterium]|nr:hypothetical protein [Candidatus Obscuribacterales bacterium]